MSNMKVVALINEAEKREAAKADAIAQDLYAALQAQTGALLDRIVALEREVDDLKTLARAQLLPRMILDGPATTRGGR